MQGNRLMYSPIARRAHDVLDGDGHIAIGMSLALFFTALTIVPLYRAFEARAAPNGGPAGHKGIRSTEHTHEHHREPEHGRRSRVLACDVRCRGR
jgi:hypothetical protein